jgi:hypothetical protein
MIIVIVTVGMTLNITTLSIMPFSILTFNIMALGISKISKKTFSIKMTNSIAVTQYGIMPSVIALKCRGASTNVGFVFVFLQKWMS